MPLFLISEIKVNLSVCGILCAKYTSDAWKPLCTVVASNHSLIPFLLCPNVLFTPFSPILFREDYILVNCTCFSVFYTGCTSWVYLQHKHLPVADVCADCRTGLQLFNEAQQRGIMRVLSIGTSLWAQKNYEWQWKKQWDFYGEQSRRPDIRPNPPS